MNRMSAARMGRVGIVAGSALIAIAVIGAGSAQAAHNPRPGGQGAGPNQQQGPAALQVPAGSTSPSTASPSTASPSTASSSTASPSTASAPSSSAPVASASTVPATQGAAGQGGPRPGGIPLRSLVGDGTITADQARAVREQLRADAQAAREQARTTALTTLVGEGALTQEQADAIVAAGRGGLRTLVANGTLTAEQAREVQAEFTEYGSADTSAASLAALVAAGVLTQEQADAIAALRPAPTS